MFWSILNWPFRSASLSFLVEKKNFFSAPCHWTFFTETDVSKSSSPYLNHGWPKPESSLRFLRGKISMTSQTFKPVVRCPSQRFLVRTSPQTNHKVSPNGPLAEFYVGLIVMIPARTFAISSSLQDEGKKARHPFNKNNIRFMFPPLGDLISIWKKPCPFYPWFNPAFTSFGPKIMVFVVQKTLKYSKFLAGKISIKKILKSVTGARRLGLIHHRIIPSRN